MMTEKEANECWCPLVKFEVSAKQDLAFNNRINKAADINLMYAGEGASRCIASKCAAWRWIKPAERKGRKVAHACGYCGLAGKP